MRQPLIAPPSSNPSLLLNSGWLYFEKFAQALVGLALTLGIARHLGPSNFGQLTFATTYIAFFYVIASFSLDALIVRDISRQPSDAGTILGSCFAIRALAGVVAWLCALISLPLISSGQDENMWLILIVGSTLLTQSFQTIDLWFQSQSSVFLGVFARLAAFSASSIIKLILLLTEAPLLYFALAFAFDGIATAVCLTLVYIKQRSPIIWRYTLLRTIQLLKAGWPLAASGLAITIYMRVDQLIVTRMLGHEALGIYATATTLTQGLAFIPTAFVAVISPTIALLRMGNRNEYQRKVALLVRSSAAFAILICTMLSLFSSAIISATFGTKFYGAAPIFSILVYNFFFVAVGLIQGIFAINESLQRVTLISTAIAAICAVFFNFIFIPRFGLLGAGYAAILSNFISVVVVPLMFSKEFRKLYLHAFLGRNSAGYPC